MTDMPQGVYSYQRLSQFRSIRLIEFVPPSRNTSEIELQIREFPLDAAPSYCALSYTWGDFNNLETLVCNDRLLEVTTNCKAAIQKLKWVLSTNESLLLSGIGEQHLGNFSLSDTLRNCSPSLTDTASGHFFLWVDAICIDQSHETHAILERHNQLRLMCEIYMRAEHTIVWLGEDSDSAQQCLDVLSKEYEGSSALVYLRENPMNMQGGRVFSSRLYNTPALQFLDPTSGLFHALDSLLLRPWFSRLWILQELTVSRKVSILCGSSLLPWDCLSSALSYISERSRQTYPIETSLSPLTTLPSYARSQPERRLVPESHVMPSSFKRAIRIADLRKDYQTSRGAGISLYHALILGHRQQCKEPADRVWALAGLSHELAAVIPILSPSPQENENTISAATLRGHIIRASIKTHDWRWFSLMLPLTLSYGAILSQLTPVSVLNYLWPGFTNPLTTYPEGILRYVIGDSSNSVRVSTVLGLILGVCSLYDIVHTSTVFFESFVGKIQLLRALFEDDELGGSQIYINASGWVRGYQLSLMVLNRDTLSAFLCLDQASQKRYIKPVHWVMVLLNAWEIVYAIALNVLFAFCTWLVFMFTTDFIISLCICAPATVIMAIFWDAKLWSGVLQFMAPFIAVLLLGVLVWWGRRRDWFRRRSRTRRKVAHFPEANNLADWAQGLEYKRWANPRYKYTYY
ncbi:hypothetical protein N431DRAFT_564779 [Stipitochalara longipes BDJ]|nr:hypothetical protein N431DRAFT_564779 [Stipitochalara longipes BDJ]